MIERSGIAWIFAEIIALGADAIEQPANRQRVKAGHQRIAHEAGEQLERQAEPAGEQIEQMERPEQQQRAGARPAGRAAGSSLRRRVVSGGLRFGIGGRMLSDPRAANPSFIPVENFLQNPAFARIPGCGGRHNA